MSEKRRDNRNRILHEGEFQRKDGCYCYKYKDVDGETRYVYSWRLDRNDRLVPGKRKDLSLREKEREIHANMFAQVSSKGKNMTVLELVEKYVSTRVNVRNTTKTGYKTVTNFLKKDSFGKAKIGSIKISDAKCWLVNLQQNEGKGYSSIQSIRGVLKPAFRMALDDDLIRKNPFDFPLKEVIVDDTVTRDAITRDQERKFLKFIKEDPHFRRYYEGFFILFKTGLRISEFVGLTIRDIDLKENKLTVDHQLMRGSDMHYYIEATKTENGKRVIPISKEVADCFRTILEKRKTPSKEPEIDGYRGFLYLDKNGMPMVALHWEKYFQHVLEKYNKTYKEELPKITPHVCRHTYCNNMANSGMNPATLQYLMGHGDISVTLNIYTHVKFDDAKQEVKRLKIG